MAATAVAVAVAGLGAVDAVVVVAAAVDVDAVKIRVARIVGQTFVSAKHRPNLADKNVCPTDDFFIAPGDVAWVPRRAFRCAVSASMMTLAARRLPRRRLRSIRSRLYRNTPVMIVTEHVHTPTIDRTSTAVERLMEQYTEMSRLAGALAHEIKNPLSTIRLNLELLAEDLEESESPVAARARKRIELTRRECRRLQKLLDDFLSYAKIRRLHLEPTDLNRQIEDLMEFFAPEADAAEIEVRLFLDPDLPRVMLDREAFRGALLNLVINAKQAMTDGGQLTVSTQAQGATAAVRVADTGPGVESKTASQMFEAFFSTKRGGSGLGLPNTAKIIEAHGGRISVQSEVGQGTQFTIEMPVPMRLPKGEVTVEVRG